MRKSILLLALAGLLLGAAPAAAQSPVQTAGEELTLVASLQRPRPSDMRGGYSADEARDARRSGDVLPAVQVIREVRMRYPGSEVLDARLMGGAQPQYVVRILARDGQRRDVYVDARTGRILYER
ncbi:MAG: hypothetical protein KIS81_09520 [Maricaulaceae bacterium]|nr:hypothetical protein [Maricaulaceae bacterium]